MPRAHAFLMVMSRRRAETCRTHHFGWGTPRLVGSSPALGRAARVTCSHDVRRNPLVTRSAASISQIIRVANMMWSPIYCAGRSKQAFRFPQPPARLAENVSGVPDAAKPAFIHTVYLFTLAAPCLAALEPPPATSFKHLPALAKRKFPRGRSPQSSAGTYLKRHFPHIDHLR